MRRALLARRISITRLLHDLLPHRHGGPPKTRTTPAENRGEAATPRRTPAAIFLLLVH